MTDATEPEVTLSLPASHERVRLARLVAAGVAESVGFDLDEIEDLRIAVDELCVVLVDHGRASGLRISYRANGADLEIRGECRYVDDVAESIELPRLTRQILETVVDEHESGVDGDAGWFVVRKARDAAGT